MNVYGDIGIDLAGYPFNKKYPPTDTSTGNLYHGYNDSFRETLFYDFAVMGYDLEVTYKDKVFHVMNDGVNGVWLSDDHYTAKIKHFPSANNFIESFEIEGHKLIDLIDEIDDVQPI